MRKDARSPRLPEEEAGAAPVTRYCEKMTMEYGPMANEAL